MTCSCEGWGMLLPGDIREDVRQDRFSGEYRTDLCDCYSGQLLMLRKINGQHGPLPPPVYHLLVSFDDADGLLGSELMTEIDIKAQDFENVVYTPQVGQRWKFHDTDIEKKWIEWEIVAVTEDEKGHPVASVEKRTGRDIGYKGAVAWNDFSESDMWECLSDNLIRVMWECPNCGEKNPIRKGDYLCEGCRKA